MKLIHRSFLILFLLTLLSACATMSPSYETPQVSVTSFSVDENSQSLVFNIGLKVVNPNGADLPLKGMSYSLEVEENRILSGAKPDLPQIGPYETAEFVIQASPDLLGGLKLLSQLLSTNKNAFDYAFKAKLDVGSLLPSIHIEEAGKFKYSP